MINFDLIYHAKPICISILVIVAPLSLARSIVGWLRFLLLFDVTFAFLRSEEWGWASLWPFWRVVYFILLIKNLLGYLRSRIIIDQLSQINIELGNVCLQFLNIHYHFGATWRKWIWWCWRRSILELAVIQKHVLAIVWILRALRHKVDLMAVALLIILWDPDPLQACRIFRNDLFIWGLQSRGSWLDQLRVRIYVQISVVVVEYLAFGFEAILRAVCVFRIFHFKMALLL